MKRLCSIGALLVWALTLYASTPSRKVVVVGGEDNLFTRLLTENGKKVAPATDIQEALSKVRKGDGVMVCAENYPEETTAISQADYKAFARKGVRLFVEFPASLPATSSASVYTADLERGVVTSSMPGLPAMSIVGINGCRVVEATSTDPLMVLAKVAGYDNAVFGLKDAGVVRPVLFKEGKALIATTSFSNAVKGRYGPADAWAKIMDYVLSWVSGDPGFHCGAFPSDPVPSYDKTTLLPQNARTEAVLKAGKWLWKANLFIHPEWEKPLLKKYQPEGGNPNRFFGEPITDDMLHGDGCRGIMEGHASSIDWDGNQEYRYFVRADVHGESAFLLSAAGKLSSDPVCAETAEKLLDYLFYTSCFRDGARSDKSSDAYGLLGWANTAPEAFFNDDNARCILGVIGASALMGNQRWNDRIVENILANFRLASKDGFIGSCLWQKDICDNGWEWFAGREGFINPSPHFESWMWALYLWLYDKTGYTPLLDKAKAGLGHMMSLYPDWIVQNGIQQERARIILPLAWLVRVEDTPEHRQWLDTVVKVFLENQDACGAIREELGTASFDHNNLLISSNAEYGKNEASLIARNGDPVADMLYTCNFGFFALNEAYRATGLYGNEVKKLGDFLVRIQVSSQAHKDLDGAWFRAFDFGRWDYWASNADNGWGAWCTLCGWIQTWIGVTEYLLSQDTSFWDTSAHVDMADAFANARWMVENRIAINNH